MRFTDHPSWTYNGCVVTTPSQSRITVEPGRCGVRPCIRHMRIGVTNVLELLVSGASEDQIFADYPDSERGTSARALSTLPSTSTIPLSSDRRNMPMGRGIAPRDSADADAHRAR